MYRGLEKRTCHWGFDPENWRHYLLVPKEQGSSEKCENEKLLEAMKAKFDVSNMSKNMSPLKRRQQVGCLFRLKLITGSHFFYNDKIVYFAFVKS